MRVLFVSGHPENGGGVAVFSELLKQRFSSDVEIDALAVGARNSVSGVALDPGILNTAKRLVTDMIKFVRIIRSEEYDAVHLNPSFGANSVLRDGVFLLFLRMMGLRSTLVFVHGWSDGFAEKVASNTLARTLFRWVYGWVPATIVLSERFRRQLLDIGFRKDNVITSSTMFDGDSLRRVTEEIVIQARHQRANERKIRLIFMSRVERNKGVYDLVDAVSMLAAQHADVQLDIVGEGTALANLKAFTETLGVSNRVTFHGYVNAPRKKADLLLDADVFCLPSSHGEGMPVSLLEGMGAGLAVISTKVGGISEACAASGAILLERSTATGVAQAIESLLQDPAYRLSLQERSRARAWDLYEARIVTRQMETYYRSLINRAAGQAVAAASGAADSN